MGKRSKVVWSEHTYRVMVVVAAGSIGLGTLRCAGPDATWCPGAAPVYADGGVPALTQQGQIFITGGAQGIGLSGTTAFVCAAGSINIIDVTDPMHLSVSKSFGSGGSGCTLNGSELVTYGSGDPFPVNIYSVADLANPQFLGSTSINYVFPHQLLIGGSYAFIPTLQFNYDAGLNVIAQHGDLTSVNLSPASSPSLADVLFNTTGPPTGGNHNVWTGTFANSTTLLIGSTTSTGADVVDGTGTLLIVDVSNPMAMSVAGTLDIPGTLQLTGLSIQGNAALAVGSSGSWNSGQSDLGLTGHIVLTALDVTDPRHPSIIAQQSMSRASRGMGTPPVNIGEGLYAFPNLGPVGGQPEVIVVNAADPHNMVTSEMPVPADVNALASGNGALYTSSAAGLYIYGVGSASGCVGDCNGNGEVTVSDVIMLVNIALGAAEASACPHGIPGSASVDIALIVQAVNSALTSCPAA